MSMATTAPHSKKLLLELLLPRPLHYWPRIVKDAMASFSVDVISALDLLAVDTKGMFSKEKVSSDPYVVLHYNKKSVGKTQVIYKNHTQPVWEKNIPFKITTKNFKPSADVLVFSLFDYDKVGSNDPLGEVRLSVADLIENKDHGAAHTYPVAPCKGCPHPTGTITIRTIVQVDGEAAPDTESKDVVFVESEDYVAPVAAATAAVENEVDSAIFIESEPYEEAVIEQEEVDMPDRFEENGAVFIKSEDFEIKEEPMEAVKEENTNEAVEIESEDYTPPEEPAAVVLDQADDAVYIASEEYIPPPQEETASAPEEIADSAVFVESEPFDETTYQTEESVSAPLLDAGTEEGLIYVTDDAQLYAQFGTDTEATTKKGKKTKKKDKKKDKKAKEEKEGAPEPTPEPETAEEPSNSFMWVGLAAVALAGAAGAFYMINKK